MAGLFSGHLVEYPRIRVDCFSMPKQRIPYPPPDVLPSSVGGAAPGKDSTKSLELDFFPNAGLYLLSHAHTDHLTGLAAVHGGMRIVCSHETKALILMHETAAARKQFANGDKRHPVKQFKSLRDKQSGKDVLYALDYNRPTTFPLQRAHKDGRQAGSEEVVITLLDANHCPGSAMFLVEGARGAVLHTGDIRCDREFRDALVKDALAGGKLGKYLQRKGGGGQQLQAMYVDTAALIGGGDLPDKRDAIKSVVDLLQRYPARTRIFVNCWTWGYEPLLIALLEQFPDDMLHVDRWKRQCFEQVAKAQGSGLRALERRVVKSGSGVKLHACDAKRRCSACWRVDPTRPEVEGGDLLVAVNPAEMRVIEWDLYEEELNRRLDKAAKGEGSWPLSLTAPLNRHSSLPELQYLVALFNPRTLYPNSIENGKQPVEVLCLPACFPSLTSETHDQLNKLARWWVQHRVTSASDVWAWYKTVVHQSLSVERGMGSIAAADFGAPSSVGHKPKIRGNIVGTKAETEELEETLAAAVDARTAGPSRSGWNGTQGLNKHGRMWEAAAAMLRNMQESGLGFKQEGVERGEGAGCGTLLTDVLVAEDEEEEAANVHLAIALSLQSTAATDPVVRNDDDAEAENLQLAPELSRRDAVATAPLTLVPAHLRKDLRAPRRRHQHPSPDAYSSSAYQSGSLASSNTPAQRWQEEDEEGKTAAKRARRSLVESEVGRSLAQLGSQRREKE